MSWGMAAAYVIVGIVLDSLLRKIFSHPLCKECGAKAMPNQTTSMIRAWREAERWESKYKNDLHNFMEQERWLEAHHPEVLDEFEQQFAAPDEPNKEKT